MSSLSTIAGRRKTLEVLEILAKRAPVYAEQLAKEGWDRVTLHRAFTVLESMGIVSYRLEFCGGMGTRKWVELTDKGKDVVGYVREIEKIIRSD
jgi:DNA-binding PadR family transcriptional regulator